jgi:hypothetical protein
MGMFLLSYTVACIMSRNFLNGFLKFNLLRMGSQKDDFNLTPLCSPSPLAERGMKNKRGASAPLRRPTWGGVSNYGLSRE